MVALRYLARYLSIIQLFQKATIRIIEKFTDSVDPYDVVEIMKAANSLHEDDLVARAMEVFAVRFYKFDSYESTRQALASLSPELALRLFESNAFSQIDHLKSNNGRSVNDPLATWCVADYCIDRKDIIDSEFLWRATKKVFEHKPMHSRLHYLSAVIINLSRDLEKDEQMEELRRHCWQACRPNHADLLHDLVYLTQPGMYHPEGEAFESVISTSRFDNFGHFLRMTDSDKVQLLEIILDGAYPERYASIQAEGLAKEVMPALERIGFLDDIIRSEWRKPSTHVSLQRDAFNNVEGW
jgi:hypothetical protein